MASLIQPRWPLLVIYPASTVGFYALYFGLHKLTPKQYRLWSDINQRTFRQNICATIHTYALIALLTVVLITEGPELQRASLMPFYSPLAYVAVGMSLGYMSLTLPWSCRMFFGTTQERAATRPSLIIHHAFVVLAELVYVLTLTSPWIGSLSFVLFEFSNLFLMPHHLMTQLQYHGRWHFINGLLFFVSCTFVRVLGCLALGVVYAVDLAKLAASDSGEEELSAGLYVAVSLSLLSFWAILMLSIYWYVKDVLSEVHKEFKIAFGDRYWLKCCPWLRRRHSTSKGKSSLTRSEDVGGHTHA